MSKLFLRIGLVVIVMVLALSLLLGCGAPAAPGAPPKAEPPAEFRIGVAGGMTGQAGPAVTRMVDELENTLKHANEVEGGISGVKLAWRIVDNKGTPDGMVIAYK